MNHSRYSIEEFKIPLVRPYRHAGILNSCRHLAVATIEWEGQYYQAELGPFPGVNQESYQTALDQFQDILPALVLQMTEPSSWDLTLPQFGLVPESLYPSVRCTVEQLLFHVYYTCHSPQRVRDFHIASLVLLDDGMEQKVKKDLASGFRTFKVKLGRISLREELKRFQGLLELLPSECKIRLDTNQQLDLGQLEAFLSMLSRDQLEYIEEPEGMVGGPWGIAFDESLWDLAVPKLRDIDRVIQKPHRLSFSTVIHWLTTKDVLPEQIVLSSCFDGSVALKNFLRFADYFQLRSDHGLGTLTSLQGDSTAAGLAKSTGIWRGVCL